jgi:hypothetical protein
MKKKFKIPLLALGMSWLISSGAASSSLDAVATFSTTRPFANPRFYVVGKWNDSGTLSFLTSTGFVDFRVPWPTSCRTPDTGEATVAFSETTENELLTSGRWVAIEVAAPSRFARLKVAGLDLECSAEVVLPLRWSASEYKDALSLEPFLVFGASVQTFRGTPFRWTVVDSRLKVSSRLSATLDHRRDLSENNYFGPSLDLEYFPGHNRWGGRYRIFSSLFSGPQVASLTNWELLLVTGLNLTSSGRWKLKPHLGFESSDWFMSDQGASGVGSSLKSWLIGMPLEVSLTRSLLAELFLQYRLGKFKGTSEVNAQGFMLRTTFSWALSDQVSWIVNGHYGSTRLSNAQHSQWGAGTGLSFFF